jgi:hypothetical protein
MSRRPPPSPIAHLKTKISGLSVTAYGGRSFVPDTELHATLSSDVIAAALLQSAKIHEPSVPGRELQSLVDYICDQTNPAYKVFASAVVSPSLDPEWLYNQIQEVRDIGLKDKHLPITWRSGEDEFDLRSIDAHKGAGSWTGTLTHYWHEAHVRQFEGEQWQFLAFVLKQNDFAYDVHQSRCLPFILGNREIERGSFGEVQAVRVHEGHQEGFKKVSQAISCYVNALVRAEIKIVFKVGSSQALHGP